LAGIILNPAQNKAGMVCTGGCKEYLRMKKALGQQS
jgi:hypothetical protein